MMCEYTITGDVTLLPAVHVFDYWADIDIINDILILTACDDMTTPMMVFQWWRKWWYDIDIIDYSARY